MEMDWGLKGKVALVTGASRGLGRATAEVLLQCGVKVVASARQSPELESLAAQHPQHCRLVAGDLLQPDFPAQCVEAAVAEFGQLDILLVNTPGPKPVLPLDINEADLQTAFNTALFPAFRLIRSAIPVMQENAWGRIVIVSSTSVRAPKPFLGLSAASRSALWAWAKSMAPELYTSGITINALFPGPHNTDRVRELGREGRPKGQPQDFALLASLLCGSASNFVTGTGITLDGGELTSISL